MVNQDRRQAPRFMADLSAYCYKTDKDGISEKHLAKVRGCVGEREGEVLAPDKVTDVSRGGLFLTTIKNYPVDTILVVELLLPERAGSVTTVGVVRWTCDVKGDEPYVCGHGINFLYMKNEDWGKIEHYVSQIKPFSLR